MNKIIDEGNENTYITFADFKRIKFKKNMPQIILDIIEHIWMYRNEEDDILLESQEHEILRQVEEYSEKYYM